MERSNHKRPADSEQTVDTFAVCSNCSRLSYNLKQCDKCGSALSEDNSSMCISAEPKRTRVESPPVSAANASSSSSSVVIVNGNSPVSPSEADNNDSGSGGQVVVPTALYVNRNAVSSSSGAGTSTSNNKEPEAVTPQELFINVTNPAFAPGRVTSSGPVSGSNSPTVDSLTTTTSAAPSVTGVTRRSSSSFESNSGNTKGAASSLSSTTSHNMNSSSVSTATVAPTTTSGGRSYNTFNLPPPSGSNPTQAVSHGAPTANNADSASDSSGSTTIGELMIHPESVTMPATQIRIGTRKFLPASSITFKEDGVLFALKDFTHAPVLLNARAIVKCQANLDHLPVFFVFLEATCIRQIRNIFGLTVDEFQENSSVNLKKCITIFPSLSPSLRKDIRQKMASTIHKIFGQMGSRYPRPGAYLNEISHMETIDVLFDSMRNVRTSDVIPHGLSSGRVASSVSVSVNSSGNLTQAHLHSNSSSSGASNNSTLLGVSSYQASAGQTRGVPMGQATSSSRIGQPPVVGPGAAQMGVTYSAQDHVPSHNMQPIRLQIPPREAAVHRVPAQQQSRSTRPSMPVTMRPGSQPRMTTVRQPALSLATQTSQVRGATPAKTSANTTGTTAPLLVVPSDGQRWKEMQKDLVEGGVYHVELPSKDRKYYLWDGTRLVPCLVQNTEIQLNCVYCRVGSLRAEVTGTKIRADEPSGISCNIKSDHTGQLSLSLSLTMISSVTTAFDKNHCIMFVNLTYNGWWHVQNSLKLGGDRDPCFNPNSQDARRKHMVFIFKNVNADQKDALLGIKNKFNGLSVFAQSPVNVTYELMSDIITSICYSQGKNARAYNLAAPLQTFMDLDRTGLPDDDDDDVIMTSEEVGIKCPYTQQVMKDPVKNKICEHNYEKQAIQEFIVRRKGNAKCPYAGCGNSKPLSMLDLEENTELREYIRRQTSNKS